ncbi:MAG: hypothetical protein M5U34_12975 [Chloroflexi bacterium]|nr:hypothetical protein [Chloroflexota bacterium]
MSQPGSNKNKMISLPQVCYQTGLKQPQSPLLVQFREDEADNDNTANNAIVNMSSYQFSSEKNAHNQLETINTTLAQENIHLLSEAVSLDDEALDLLSERSTSWHIQIGRDDENLLAYFLWIQWDNYVSETYIAVEEDNEQIAEKTVAPHYPANIHKGCV